MGSQQGWQPGTLTGSPQYSKPLGTRLRTQTPSLPEPTSHHEIDGIGGCTSALGWTSPQRSYKDVLMEVLSPMSGAAAVIWWWWGALKRRWGGQQEGSWICSKSGDSIHEYSALRAHPLLGAGDRGQPCAPSKNLPANPKTTRGELVCVGGNPLSLAAMTG